MKYKNISFLIAGVLVMSGSLISITTLLAQELAPANDPLPVTNSEEVQPLVGEQNARTRQQNIRAEQLQRQRPNNSEQNQPIRPNILPEGESRKQEGRVEINSNKEQRMMDQCEKISSNISQHKERFNAKSEIRMKVYNKVVARLEIVSNRLNATGVDTNVLNTYITEIKTKITALEGDSISYSNSLTLNSSELCEQEDIQNTLDAKKQELQAIIEQDKGIRRMIRDTIVPYLKTLRPISVEQSEPETSNEPTNPSPVTTPIQ